MPNPVALPKPAPKGSGSTTTPAIRYYEGNVQLLEARFLELSSSIRALHRSVEELREFCKDPNTQDDADHVVVEAIFENLGVLRKQRKELVSVVGQMNQKHNVNTNVPDDILVMVLGDEEQEKAEAEASAAAERRIQEASNSNGVGVGEGVYL